MCHTTLNTHLICLHTTSSTIKCTAALGYLIPTFISLLFSPPKCTKTSNKEYTDAFCSTCTEIFKQYSIDEQETRARILRYRERNSYFGTLTPFANEEGAVEFLREKTNPKQREHGPGDRTEFGCEGNGEEETRKQLERWWGGESSSPAEMNDDVESKSPQQSRSRTSSNSSTCTVWPGPWPDSTQALPSPSNPSSSEKLGKSIRRASEADIGTQRLDTLGFVEFDDFGQEVESPVPPPAYLARDEVKNAGVFELKDLEVDLLGSMNVEGYERQKVTKPLQLFPMEEPQRRSGDERKLC